MIICLQSALKFNLRRYIKGVGESMGGANGKQSRLSNPGVDSRGYSRAWLVAHTSSVPVDTHVQA